MEKIGEPKRLHGKIVQRLKKEKVDGCRGCTFWHDYSCDINDYIDCRGNEIFVEIKQNREDMEERKLKPFDLEKAKAGKPVCTRSGRKARIICFDAKGSAPIIALVEKIDHEEVYRYHSEGSYYSDRDFDLMMVSEKKEGWINLYRSKLNNSVCRRTGENCLV